MIKVSILSRPCSLRLSLVTLFVCGSTAVFASSACVDLIGCERKICEIERQLDDAKLHGNKKQEQGLAKALLAVQQHCTSEYLMEALLDDIKEKKQDIIDYQNDKQDAEREGKLQKVEKYQQKIERQQAELERLQQELADLSTK
ncbi:DUF1090 family protein [Vibrio sp. V27_P1S3P104]|uniref:DUF1090 domain-containing protein n=1 Tax=Vibrio TaxID=662 RepID=UPI000C167F56|nr:MULTISPECIES: DUF1090 domain-containing protein [Vibrio]NAW70401.1 DUF1090 family protein [Vibrio sp. V28_P6S34P95]NAX04616.1 DUF1090 family protein [Vibrio sp. V30_P3S12P165]NAX33595.1 DUF1090 family protein [Vibrio sp. V29_P1S30P107]NAX38659.1 DUF1090 family protein [Vibrio sp. V27_P1S3P104]NAX39906.1 DUF1090 family protein [Vibrio sp. V26_P1S5P106]